MSPARYEELLGRLLEQELSEEDARELARGLREDAALREDLRRHLLLWELWSQSQSAERSAEAFLNSFKTRLRASDEDARAFSDAVRVRIKNEDRAGQTEPRRAGDSAVRGGITSQLGSLAGAIARLRQGRLRRPGLALVASLGVAVLLALAWLGFPRSAQALTTIRGEAVCTACVLHQTREHLPAVLVIRGHSSELYYLSTNRATANMQPYFCGGPTPVVAEGKAKQHDGRLSFDAVSVNIVNTNSSQPRPAKN
jgi:hypothetical protein